MVICLPLPAFSSHHSLFQEEGGILRQVCLAGQLSLLSRLLALGVDPLSPCTVPGMEPQRFDYPVVHMLNTPSPRRGVLSSSFWPCVLALEEATQKEKQRRQADKCINCAKEARHLCPRCGLVPLCGVAVPGHKHQCVHK